MSNEEETNQNDLEDSLLSDGFIENDDDNNNEPPDEILGDIDSKQEQTQQNKPNETEALIVHNNEGQSLMEKVDCPICIEQITDIKSLVKLECEHVFCLTCFSEYIKEEINNLRVPIKCPDYNCKELIEEEFLKQYLFPDLLNKYNKFIKKKRIIEIPGSVECPYVDCDSYAINPELINQTNDNNIENRKSDGSNSSKKSKGKKKKQIKEYSILECIDNKHQFCSNCRHPPHPGKKCVNEEKFQLGLLLNWEKSKNVKKCPKCGFHIEKTEGCNHMSCTRCQHQFCWLCGGIYYEGHFENPLSPCFDKMYAAEPTIWAKYCILKWIRGLLIILFPVPVLFLKITTNIVNQVEEDIFDKCYLKYIYPFTAMILGLGLTSYGYIIITIIIDILPLFFSIYFSALVIEKINDEDREDEIGMYLIVLLLPLVVANVPLIIVFITGIILCLPIILSVYTLLEKFDIEG